MYEPSTPKMIAVRSRVSDETWQRRVAEAREAEATVKEILAMMEAEGISQNKAIRRLLPEDKRSWAIARLNRYKAEGFEALISSKTPREPKLSREIAPVVHTLREANPKATVEEAWAALKRRGVKPLPSEATIKREFRKVDDRRRYAEKKRKAETPEVTELELAGGQLLAAAEVETGLTEAMTATVVEYTEAAQDASDGTPYEGDVAHRDREGKFTKTYNRKRKRKPGEKVASYLLPAEEKGEERPDDWARFTHEKEKTLRFKTATLVHMPAVVQGKGWDALREPGTEALEELTGFAYMPSTMAKYTSALAISGLGDALLETVGKQWHLTAQEHWNEAGGLSAIYVDNMAKEVWSSLFTKAGKVSHLSRVMPCITTTYVHTGAGTPLVMGVHSGSAPLAEDLLKTVERAEETLEMEVERVTVIDAEGSTFDVLQSFKNAGRAIVTPLKPSRLKELELRYEPGSYYRPFREHDELRVAKGTLARRSSKEALEVGVLLIRRQGREQETVLVTTGLEMGMKGRQLAELYFNRWPMQENTFKDWRALQLGEHRGNCSRMVTNVRVVTKLEKLVARREEMETKRDELTRQADEEERARVTAAHELRKVDTALEVRRRRLDEVIESGKTGGAAFAKAAKEHHSALELHEKLTTQLDEVTKRSEKAARKRDELTRKLEAIKEDEGRLESMQTIRELDVEQDKILTAHKLAAAGIMTYALREYFPGAPMTPATFQDRVLKLRGRREVTADRDHVTLYANPRDPQMAERLEAACDRITKRRLMRDGRRLSFSIEEMPTTSTGNARSA
jgi:hypothetical protein